MKHKYTFRGTLAELPENFSTRYFIGKIGADKMLLFVAVVGRADDWAAYFGINELGINEVARIGDKMPESDARSMFPLMHGEYRR